MRTVQKVELTQRIAKFTQVRHNAVMKVVRCFLGELGNELALGNRLQFRNFGSFRPFAKQVHRGRNPHTGERIDIPAHTIIKFRMGRLLKERLNGKR